MVVEPIGNKSPGAGPSILVVIAPGALSVPTGSV